jgi:hypothetical protein
MILFKCIIAVVLCANKVVSVAEAGSLWYRCVGLGCLAGRVKNFVGCLFNGHHRYQKVSILYFFISSPIYAPSTHTHTFQIFIYRTLPQITLDQCAPTRDAPIRNMHICPHYKNPTPSYAHDNNSRTRRAEDTSIQQLPQQMHINIPTLLRRADLRIPSLGFPRRTQKFLLHMDAWSEMQPIIQLHIFYMYTL